MRTTSPTSHQVFIPKFSVKNHKIKMGSNISKIEERLDEQKLAAEKHMARIELIMEQRRVENALAREQVEQVVNVQRDDINSLARGLKNVHEELSKNKEMKEVADMMLVKFLARISDTNVYLGKALR